MHSMFLVQIQYIISVAMLTGTVHFNAIACRSEQTLPVMPGNTV